MEKIVQLHTAQELAESIMAHKKALILFLGTCHHCNPGKERFEAFVQEESANDVHYFKISVTDKPDILALYKIVNRPTVHLYVDTFLKKSLEQDDINSQNLKELIL